MQPPMFHFGNLLDDIWRALTFWRKPDAVRLRQIMEGRSAHSAEWQLYYSQQVAPRQIEVRIAELKDLRSRGRLSNDDKFVLRWLERQYRYLKHRQEAYEDPKFKL
jgi:hypothetical protein